MQLLYFFESIRNPVLNALMRGVTELGGESLYLATALAVYWCVNKYEGYYLLASGFLGTLINQVLKLAFRIPRPWVLDPNFTIVESARAGAGGYSFPSGHTQSAVAVFGGLAMWHRDRRFRAGCAAAILLVMLSRMYLGVHTLLDVGVSLAVGLVLMVALYPLTKGVEARPQRLLPLLGVTLVLCLAYLCYVLAWPFPADLDRANWTLGIETGWKFLGAVLGMLLAAFLDQKYIHFSTDGPFLCQVLKTALGLTLAVLLKGVLKAPLTALLGGKYVAYAVRYFIVVVFAAAVWPLSFPLLTGKQKKEAEHE